MPRPNLGKFILDIDYPKCRKDDDGKFDNQLVDIEHKLADDVTLKELKDGFAAFEKKICVREFPPEHSGPYYAAYSTAKVLTRLLGKATDDDKQKGAEGADMLLHAWECLVRAGPNSTHLDLMEVLTNASPNMMKYVQTLAPKRVVEIVRRMKIDIEYQKCEDMGPSKYGSCLKHGLGLMYEKLTTDQYRAVQGDFLDVYAHYQSQLPRLPEEMASHVNHMLNYMPENFEDKNPYLRLQDMDVYKKQLAVVEQLVLSDVMGTSEPVSTTARQTLKLVLSAIMAETGSELFQGLFDPLMMMLTRICKHEQARQHADDIFDVCRCSLLNAMKDAGKVPTDAIFRSGMALTAELLSAKYITQDTVMFMDKLQQELVFKFPKASVEQKRSVLTMVRGYLLSGSRELAKQAEEVIDSSKYKDKKFFAWKEFVPEARLLIGAVGELPADQMENSHKMNDLYWTVKQYDSFMERLLEFLKKAKVLPQVAKSLITCIFNCLDDKMVDKLTIAQTCSTNKYLDITKNDKESVDYALQRIDAMMKNKELPWDNMDLVFSVQDLLLTVVTSYFGRGNAITREQNASLVSIATTVCTGGESLDEHFYQPEDADRGTIQGRLYQSLLLKLVVLHKDNSLSDSIAPVIPGIFKWAFVAIDEDNDVILKQSLNVLKVLVVNAGDVMKDFLPQIVDLLLKTGKCSDMHSMLHTLYPMNRTAVHDRLQELFDLLDDLGESDVLVLKTVFLVISQNNPEVFSDTQISSLLQLYRTCPKPAQYGLQLLSILRAIAEKCPKHLEPHFQTFLDDGMFKVESLPLRAGIIYCLGGLSQKLGERAIDYLMQYADHSDPMIVHVLLGTVQGMAPKHVEHIQQYRARIESINAATTNPTTKEDCHQIILIMDGKNIEGVIEDMKQQQEDMTELDTKVDATIDTVVTIGGHVIDHDRKIAGVEKGLEEVEERVDDAEVDIKDTKVKVEEVDNKTMTNAPKWSRDLTKLMNPAADNDWRLLASRLGYSNTDIRGWTQQNDPCMALLSEWYATHKTSEASHAVLTALQEMNRVDGAVIVENAMKAAEGVVEDEEFDYPSPPPVFLSYQWGIQDEVRLLQQHLSMAGYPCWLDIGQMGGGDKLFAKIDNGIRAAKLVICCTTEKYAMSPNCNREVNLAVNLGKPIIPLLMEKMDWPPKGSMGPIFSEYLFVRFFQRGGEATPDQRYWPLPKFQELLMQLNFYVVPDGALIKKEYKDWWKPMVEEIVIDKDKMLKANTSQSNQTKGAEPDERQPAVFLSYQWGKQPQIKVLYQRLTRLGYTVWMDIYQMGGGDSLYDKIDRGLRGCNTVVSCVTPKYALSANCRREISLADALKKPVIPLLLEQMKWPPDGPMSMVFTELLYINFHREPEVQTTWTGATFDELIGKLQQYVPDIGPSSKSEPAIATDVDKTAHVQAKPGDDSKVVKKYSNDGSNNRTMTTEKSENHAPAKSDNVHTKYTQNAQAKRGETRSSDSKAKPKTDNAQTKSTQNAQATRVETNSSDIKAKPKTDNAQTTKSTQNAQATRVETNSSDIKAKPKTDNAQTKSTQNAQATRVETNSSDIKAKPKTDNAQTKSAQNAQATRVETNSSDIKAKPNTDNAQTKSTQNAQATRVETNSSDIKAKPKTDNAQTKSAQNAQATRVETNSSDIKAKPNSDNVHTKATQNAQAKRVQPNSSDIKAKPKSDNAQTKSAQKTPAEKQGASIVTPDTADNNAGSTTSTSKSCTIL